MWRLPFELFLALRYLRPKRTFVSVITLISVIGVTVGVWVLIIVISVMSGFDQQLREKILGFNSHIKIFKRETTPLDNYKEVMRVVSANPDVKGAAPFVLGQVLVKTQPATGNSLVGAPWVRGIDPRYETNVSILPKSVTVGEYNLEGKNALVGVELARSLRLHVGDRLAVYAPRKEDFEKLGKKPGPENEEGILPEEFTVSGIFDVGYYEYNANVMITSLGNAQDLYRLEDTVHGMLIMLRDPFKAEEVRSQLHQVLGNAYQISLWTEENSGLLNALMVEKNVMFMIMFVTMVVAAFGIMGTLIAFVVHKTREIGILKALGAASRQVMVLFLSQSLLVGIIGIASGFGLAMLSLAYRNEFLHVMNRLTGLELFPAAIYSFTELPALIVPADVALICGGALVMCILAGLVPAWTAARLRPVEALRHE